MTFELPPEQNNAAAWYGPEMSKRSDWAMPLTYAEVAEVESATKVLAAREAVSEGFREGRAERDAAERELMAEYRRQSHR